MFSLGALTAQASETGAAKKAGAARGDDSGLIDLAALAAQMEKADAEPKVPAFVPVFPFGAPEPPPAPPAPVEAAPEKTPSFRRGGKTWIAAAGALALAVGIAGVAAARSATPGESVALHGRVAPIFELAARATKLPVEAPATAPQDEKKPEAIAQNDATTQRTRAQRSTTSTVRTVKDPPDKQLGRSTGPDVKPPPASDPCHGDLMCAMRRAAGNK